MMTTLEEVLKLAYDLPIKDKVRLIALLAADVEHALQLPEEAKTSHPGHGSLFGILSTLGPAPSVEEIREARREMWCDYMGDA